MMNYSFGPDNNLYTSGEFELYGKTYNIAFHLNYETLQPIGEVYVSHDCVCLYKWQKGTKRLFQYIETVLIPESVEYIKNNQRLKLHAQLNHIQNRVQLRNNKIADLEKEIEKLQMEIKNLDDLFDQKYEQMINLVK